VSCDGGDSTAGTDTSCILTDADGNSDLDHSATGMVDRVYAVIEEI